MRKLALALILGAALALGLGVTAPAASAASCSYAQNITYKDNLAPAGMYYAAVIHSCVGVEAVKWVYSYYGYLTGWFDWTQGGWAQGYLAWNKTAYGTADLTQVSSCTGQCVAWVHMLFWWHGPVAPCRTISGRWYAKIKSTATHAWSDFIIVDNPQQVLCN